MYSVQCTVYSLQPTVYSVQCIVYNTSVLYSCTISVLVLDFVNLLVTIVLFLDTLVNLHFTGLCCIALGIFYTIFMYYDNLYCFTSLNYCYIWFIMKFYTTSISVSEQEGWQKRRMLTQHNSATHKFHILSRKDGKNGECWHNIILLLMNFIFWAGMMEKTANVNTT